MRPKTVHSQKAKPRVFAVGRLPRWIIYKPLVILMVILLLPVLSWLEAAGAGAPPFQAQAQINLGSCASQNNSIIQTYCLNGVVYYNDLVQFENDAVSAYLSLHGLPASDAHLIYDTVREDVRNEIRGFMMDILKAIILKPASNRTAHEQTLYTWLQTMVQQNEISEYTLALSHFNHFFVDPCTFELDQDIASQFSLKFNGIPWCYGNLPSAIFAPPIPAADYFIAYGIQHSYNDPVRDYPNFGQLVAGTASGEVTTVVAQQTLAGIAALSQVVGLVSQYFTIESIIEVSDLVSGADFVLTTLDAVALYSGPVGILLACVLAAIQASLEIYTNQAALDTLNNVKQSLALVQAAPPDLAAFLKSATGQYKLRATFVSQTLPDQPSRSALPAHQAADLNFFIAPAGGGPATVSSSLKYQDWSQNTWTAQTTGGWFDQTCKLGAASTLPCAIAGSPQPDALNTSFHYVDWSGANWIATRIGMGFVNVKADPASGGVVCPADPATGVTLSPDLSKCLSYVSAKIPLTTDTGSHVSVSFSTLSSPAFTSNAYAAFGPDVPSTLEITATGNPLPSICVVSNNLPANFNLNGGNCATGTFNLAFNGAANAAVGSYTLVLKASSSAGSVTQNFVVDVSPQLAIISPNSMNVTNGIPASFTVVATGNPTPALSMDPNFFLGGLSFKDNGNGTGIISGIYNSNVLLTCGGFGAGACGVIAKNSQGTVEQQFTINVSYPPAPSVGWCATALPTGSCPGTTFYAGAPNQTLLTSSGALTPVSWNLTSYDLPVPQWVKLLDNGDGTAVLQGTPPAGTTGTFNVLVQAIAVYAAFPAQYVYPITVLNAPVFTTGSTATFTVGTNSVFGLGVNLGTISLNNTLPPGLSFSNDPASLGCVGCEAGIHGTADPGSGGQYTIRLTDDGGASGQATETLTLNVNEAPTITSPNIATVFAGVPAALAVTTVGFPTASAHAIPANATTPTDPAQGNGTFFTVTGLPSTLHATNLNPQGFAGGTLTIQGTPTNQDVGVYPVQITAANGVGTPATQTLKLTVLNYNPTSQVNLLSNWTLSRDSSNDVIATVVFSNNSTSAAQTVTINSAKIGTVSGTASPGTIPTIAPGSTGTFQIVFPAASLGKSGTAGVLSISGSSSGGTISSAGRIVLP